MERERSIPREQEEQRENFGRNVKIRAIFVRHGEKVPSTTTWTEDVLSERGIEESKRFGEKLEKKKAIKAYSSDTERTKETARLIVESSPTEKKMVQRVSKELGFYCSKEGNFVHEAMEIRKEIFGEDFDNLPEEEKRKRIHEADGRITNYYLSFNDKRPDPQTYSPVETAAMVARRVDLYIRMVDKLYSHSDIDLINVSHDFPLSAFLKEVMLRNVEGKIIRGFEKIEEIGGPIDFNEGFEILIQTDEKGEKSVKMIFRGQEYQIDMQRLKELVEIAKALEKTEKQEK
jgi:broad specificity phosphatase PhoE